MSNNNDTFYTAAKNWGDCVFNKQEKDLSTPLFKKMESCCLDYDIRKFCRAAGIFSIVAYQKSQGNINPNFSLPYDGI